jgi:UDP-2,3-diacylglucosamine pyrophosphatase LpxH
MEQYYDDGFTYIEVGDGDEFWENPHVYDIQVAHLPIFKRQRQFLRAGRLYLILGNHNWNPTAYTRDLAYITGYRGQVGSLLAGIKVYEAIILDGYSRPVLVTHGHQVDFISSRLYPFNMLAVRHIWRPLQFMGIKDPTSPATNRRRQSSTETALVDWVRRTDAILIAGHTHLARLAYPHPRYFNTGCCVFPWCITALEIENGKITLVKWQTGLDENGRMGPEKVVMEGPRDIL